MGGGRRELGRIEHDQVETAARLAQVPQRLKHVCLPPFCLFHRQLWIQGQVGAGAVERRAAPQGLQRKATGVAQTVHRFPRRQTGE
jgi:hypothetical protein